MTTVPRAMGWALALAIVAAAAACSLDNQEGPLTTCEALECGRVNACENGIIAQCVDGHSVLFHVCSTDDICGADWQIVGQFRCAEEDTDCEGCRPEREGCNDLPPLGGGGAGGNGAGGEPEGGGGATFTAGGGGAGGQGGAGGASSGGGGAGGG